MKIYLQPYVSFYVERGRVQVLISAIHEVEQNKDKPLNFRLNT